MREITLVQQGKNECTLACLAMVSGRSLAEVKEVFPEFDGLGVSLEDMIRIIKRLGLSYVLQVNPQLFWGRVYIVTVPSLNVKGGNHNVVVDTRWGDTVESIRVLDPGEGLVGKESYGSWVFGTFGYSEVVEVLVVEGD